ncbi:peroxiredoxin, partial [Rhizobium johnstonii]
LDIKLSPPGSSRAGTNPEQLFASGWSACFIGAIGIAAGKLKVKLPVVAIRRAVAPARGVGLAGIENLVDLCHGTLLCCVA